MSVLKYDKQIEPVWPVAVKLNQNRVLAPAHKAWGIVKCDRCQEQFMIGPHRNHPPKISDRVCAERLEVLLADDHRKNRPHADSYEFAD